jgi:hypothetical protein
MKNALTLIIAIIGALLIVANQAVADDVDGYDHMNGDDHMDVDDLALLFGPWPLFGMGFMVYWFLAIPIGLLVFSDAKERRMKGGIWLFFILIPWIGLLAVIPYLMVSHGRPRIDIHDPWTKGDRYMERMRSSRDGR